MLKVIIVTLFAMQLLLWSSGRVDGEGGTTEYPEPSCPSCMEEEHCEHILKDDNCEKAPCEFTPECVKTTGITCANVRCARARCYLTKTCENDSSDKCTYGPRCIKID